jgi:hypothetical protein
VAGSLFIDAVMLVMGAVAAFVVVIALLLVGLWLLFVAPLRNPCAGTSDRPELRGTIEP